MLRIKGVKLAAQPIVHERKPGKTDTHSILVRVRVTDGSASNWAKVRFKPWTSKVKAPKDGGVDLSPEEMTKHREACEKDNLKRMAYYAGLADEACKEVAQTMGLLKKGKDKPE